MENFNVPSPERTALLELLQEKLGSVKPQFWAACQICDPDAFQTFLNTQVAFVAGLQFGTCEMIHYWTSSPTVQSRPSTPKTPTPNESTVSNITPSPSTLPPPLKRQKILDSPTTLPRDADIRKLAEERDNFCCVLTGIEIAEVVDIYPYHLMNQKEEDKSGSRHFFWGHLRAFWSDEKVADWEAKLFPQGIGEKGQEQVYNLISFAPTVRTIWGRGLFAIKPISQSDDKKTLTVQFFWQEKQMDLSPRINLTTKPISTEGLKQSAGVWLFDKNGKRIQSGDCFELQTDDPDHKPLPSFELLELQWFLHRIQGMAGSADVDLDYRLDRSSDSDNGIEEVLSPRYDNDDVEEFSLVSQ